MVEMMQSVDRNCVTLASLQRLLINKEKILLSAIVCHFLKNSVFMLSDVIQSRISLLPTEVSA